MSCIRVSPSRDVKLSQLDGKAVTEMAHRDLLEALRLVGRGPQSRPELLLDVVLAAASSGTSLEYVCENYRCAPTSTTLRETLKANLTVEELERRANEALGLRLNAGFWKQPQMVAVDLVEIPYHGTFESEPEEVRRGKAKSGTTHFHAYATAYVVRKGRRLTLAVRFVRSDSPLSEVLTFLEQRLTTLGITVALWLADRGFASVECLRWFDQRQEAIVPLPVKGKTDPPTATRALAALVHSGWHSYTMRSSEHGELSFKVAVVRRRRQRSRAGDARPAETLLYALLGTKPRRDGTGQREPEEMAELYRLRFGIESSYRQLHEARFRTSSRSPMLRLLSVAVSFLLLNLRALIAWMSQARPGAGRRAVGAFPFRTLLQWIDHHLKSKLLFQTSITLEIPSGQRF